MKQYKFLITIPTLNSEKTIGLAIESVLKQEYSNFECNIVDSFSKDNTQSIANDLGVKIISYPGKLLGARYEGFINSDCDYVIFMDSDQVFEKTFLKRLNSILNQSAFDMVILEEHSYRKNTWVEKMYDLDRTIVQKEFDYNVSPEHGVLLPRVFKRSLLVKAFNNIVPSLYPEVVAHDHAIIYYECYKISQKIGFLDKAVFHQEPPTLHETFRHFISYGKNTRKFKKMGLYNDLIEKKMSGRNKGFIHNIFSKKILTSPLLFSKAAGYYWGYWQEK